MVELKPCPFCGGKAFIDHFMQPHDEWRIRCMDCSARVGRYAGLNKKEVTEAWNRRHEEPKQGIDFDYGAED